MSQQLTHSHRVPVLQLLLVQSYLFSSQQILLSSSICLAIFCAIFSEESIAHFQFFTQIYLLSLSLISPLIRLVQIQSFRFEFSIDFRKIHIRTCLFPISYVQFLPQPQIIFAEPTFLLKRPIQLSALGIYGDFLHNVKVSISLLTKTQIRKHLEQLFSGSTSAATFLELVPTGPSFNKVGTVLAAVCLMLFDAPECRGRLRSSDAANVASLSSWKTSLSGRKIDGWCARY